MLHTCDAAAAERFRSAMASRAVEPSAEVVEPAVERFRTVVQAGAARGDVRSDAVREPVLDVVAGLLMYRSKVCGSELPDQNTAKVIDQVVVPLLRPDSCLSDR
ncbi:TetR-like C-terminal domain-containing protein [Streptomyces sp. NPDC048389]|uniref:TetR-like C-terminal domain-containing protein n=1 Tax=Streptomyces sp. NPDC048389 TaxID=3154622 RepID=UPI0034512366